MKEITSFFNNFEDQSEKVINLIDKCAENLRLNGSFECLKYQKI
jgi:hypothetical protein